MSCTRLPFHCSARCMTHSIQAMDMGICGIHRLLSSPKKKGGHTTPLQLQGSDHQIEGPFVWPGAGGDQPAAWRTGCMPQQGASRTLRATPSRSHSHSRISTNTNPEPLLARPFNWNFLWQPRPPQPRPQQVLLRQPPPRPQPRHQAWARLALPQRAPPEGR